MEAVAALQPVMLLLLMGVVAIVTTPPPYSPAPLHFLPSLKLIALQEPDVGTLGPKRVEVEAEASGW